MRLSKSKKNEPSQYEVKSFYITEIKTPPPEPDDDYLEKITAKEATAMINRNQSLENKHITGDLILGRQDLENPFEIDTEDGHKVQMAGLPGHQNFVRISQNNKVEFKKCLIDGKVVFAGMDFKNEVRFLSTRFCDELDFQFAVFNKPLIFYGCYLQGKVSLSDSTFWDYVHFDKTLFRETADFFNTSFQKEVSYKHAVFYADCTFSGSRFRSSMLINPCLDFNNVVCHETAYFKDADFKGIADFEGAQFRRKSDFINAKFNYINLRQAQFGWFEMKWEQIGRKRLLFGTVSIPDIDVSKKYISEEEFNKSFQNRSDTPLTEKHRQYDILKGIFLNQGDFVSADGCFYDWKQIERKESRLGWNPESWIVKIFHYINWLSCGYGVKPIRTLFFASIMILLFGIIFTITNPSFELTVPFYSLNEVFMSSFVKNTEYSFLVFMNFTSVTTEAGSIQHVFYLIERILGWITLILFVTTYTRIMLR